VSTTLTYSVNVDFAYESALEAWEITMFERDYGVTAKIVDRVNGWPVLQVTSSSRKVLEDILEARDEAWRVGEIKDESADDFDDCSSCRGMYGGGQIV